MPEHNSLKILGHQLGIDFEQDTLSIIMDKLAASGMKTFRLNWKQGISICIVFHSEASKQLNDALDAYLQNLDKTP